MALSAREARNRLPELPVVNLLEQQHLYEVSA